MRHPKLSYHLSDSLFGIDSFEYCEDDYTVAERWCDYLNGGPVTEDTLTNKEREEQINELDKWLIENGVLYSRGDFFEYAFIGPQDLDLMQKLIKGGPEHRKFMRQIFVSVDITAPLYWWKEFDTYKVGTVANSTSTMHKMASKPITLDCFEIDDFNNIEFLEEYQPLSAKTVTDADVVQMVIIPYLEFLRLKFLETKDKKYWKELIRWLPESWLQTRTVTMNYENLLAMCSKGQRRYHKLNEWSGIDCPENEYFVKMCRTLPYAQELLFLDELD
jgi:hypothetical protein